jgi:hypothetical protein
MIPIVINQIVLEIFAETKIITEKLALVFTSKSINSGLLLSGMKLLNEMSKLQKIAQNTPESVQQILPKLSIEIFIKCFKSPSPLLKRKTLFML